MIIKVIDRVTGFKVNVLTESNGKIITSLPWHGGDFTYRGKDYTVRGPYHGLDDYIIYQLNPVYDHAEAKKKHKKHKK